MRKIHYKRAGHCTRCEKPLEDSARMVVEQVYWQFLGSGENTVGFHQQEIVPVCSECATPKEQAEAYSNIICGGCGLELYTSRFEGARLKRTCSTRCEQRVRRARHQHMRPAIQCQVCKKPFKPYRTDAEFCSGRCRQWAYRRRQNPGIAGVPA
jgi:hypothetical protein